MEQPYISSYNHIYFIGTTLQIPAIEEYHFEVSPNFEVPSQTSNNENIFKQKILIQSPSENLQSRFAFSVGCPKVFVALKPRPDKAPCSFGASWGVRLENDGNRKTHLVPRCPRCYRRWNKHWQFSGKFLRNITTTSSHGTDWKRKEW